jgi:hypothetical protein
MSGARSAPRPYHPMDPIRARRRTRDSISHRYLAAGNTLGRTSLGLSEAPRLAPSRHRPGLSGCTYVGSV